MHNKLLFIKFKREVMRKWLFKIKLGDILKDKLMVMYKSMQVHYMELTENLYGDSNSETHMMSGFKKINEKVGDFDSDYNNKKKHYRTVTKKYEFNENEISDKLENNIKLDEKYEKPEEEKNESD